MMARPWLNNDAWTVVHASLFSRDAERRAARECARNRAQVSSRIDDAARHIDNPIATSDRTKRKRIDSRSMRVCVALALYVGCARTVVPVPPSRPSSVVRSEVEQAEAAETARRHDAARTHYERAVAAARDPASTWFARREFAETLISWGEYPAAIRQLDGALAARPDDPASWHDLGMLRFKTGDLPGAIAALERARGLAPRDHRPRIALAAARWKTGDRSGAAAEYRGLLELPLPDRLRTRVEWALAELAKRE